MKNTLENRKKIAGIIAKSWMDNDYKKALIKSPKKMIQNAGIKIDGDYAIEVLQDKPKLKNFVIDSESLPRQLILTEKDLPTLPNFYQASAYIYQKAATDKYFRAFLIQHPIEAFEDINYFVPEGLKIAVKENTDNKKYFVIPVKPKASIDTESLHNEVAMFSTAPVNANANINANANVNINGDVNVNGGLQVNLVAAVTVGIAVLI